MRMLLLLLLSSLISGCASQRYANTRQATYSGALDVRWIRNDYFLFIPDPKDPFTVTRAGGGAIQPGRMYTDGGSIPRFLWGVKGLSPWGYAPAYIVHDWVFQVHHCDDPNESKYTFSDSVDIMAESLKAVMEYDSNVRDHMIFDAVVEGVSSPIAFRLWQGGTCRTPPSEVQRFLGPNAETPPDVVMRIQFGPRR